MAAQCGFLSLLEGRIADLKAKFMKDQLELEKADPLGFEPDLDRLAAFRLLVHAEFEDYLESKAKEGIAAVQKAFLGGVTSIRDNHQILVIGMTLGKLIRFDPEFWIEDVNAIVRDAMDWIADNNGIKETSFAKLSVFSGKMPDEVDAGLAAGLTSYGKSRGDVAHRSVSRVRTLQAPSAEVKAVDDLLRDLRAYFA